MKTNLRNHSWLRLMCATVVALFSMTVMAQTGEDEVLNKCEVMPRYPGGEAAMMKFLCDNVKYPKEAQEQKKQGRVIVQMVIRKDGTLTDFKVVKSASDLLDAEALRVAKLLPKFTPGKEKGQPVSVRYTFPVAFRLK